MPEQSAQKTEQPTSRRLSKARSKGQVPQSQELTSVVTLLVLVAMVAVLAPKLLQWFMVQIRQGMSCENGIFADSSGFLDFINRKTVDMTLVVFPILAALAAGSFIASVAVSG